MKDWEEALEENLISLYHTEIRMIEILEDLLKNFSESIESYFN